MPSYKMVYSRLAYYLYTLARRLLSFGEGHCHQNAKLWGIHTNSNEEGNALLTLAISGVSSAAADHLHIQRGFGKQPIR